MASAHLYPRVRGKFLFPPRRTGELLASSPLSSCPRPFLSDCFRPFNPQSPTSPQLSKWPNPQAAENSAREECSLSSRSLSLFHSLRVLLYCFALSRTSAPLRPDSSGQAY